MSRGEFQAEAAAWARPGRGRWPACIQEGSLNQHGGQDTQRDTLKGDEIEKDSLAGHREKTAQESLFDSLGNGTRHHFCHLGVTD